MRYTGWYARITCLIGLLLFLLGPIGTRLCLAHPANIPAATAQVRPDGTFEIHVRFDVLAFLLEDTSFNVQDEPMNALLDGPTETLQSNLIDGEKRFREEVRVGTDTGDGTIDSIAFPTLAAIIAWRDSGAKPRLPVMGTATVRGHLPRGAKTVSFRFSDLLGTVILTTELPYREPFSEPLDAGASSTPLPLPTAQETARAKAAMLAPRTAATPTPVATPSAMVPKPAAKPVGAPSLPKPSPSPVPQVFPTPQASPSTSPSPVAKPTVKPTPSPSPVALMATRDVPPAPLILPSPEPVSPLPWYVVAGRYVKLGYLHILPEGVDHILFVLGLFLLSTRLKPLITQITAFTLAHSLTLGLAVYGVVRLPSSIVEPLIALSIAFVAVENLFVTEMKAWRIGVVFGFGLIHGLGFAGALQDLGLQKRDLLVALVGFNGGVELGQLTVVALALLTVGWFRSRSYYRNRIVVPGSLIIAVVALYWLFQRLHS